MTLKHVHGGMSLVELLIALGMLTTLVGLAVPGFLGWIQNAQIRTTTESIASGLQLARTEALRRNSAVRFQFVSTLSNSCELSTSVGNWLVSRDNPASKCGGTVGAASSTDPAPRIIQAWPAVEGGANAVVAADQSAIVFNGLGRVTPTPDGNININVSNPTAGVCAASGGTVRCLRVVVSPGGQIRTCDPHLSSGDTQAC